MHGFAPVRWLLFLISLLSLLHATTAQKTAPTNSTLKHLYTDNSYIFSTSQFSLDEPIRLAPLTKKLTEKAQKCNSAITHISPSNVNSIRGNSIALISCDAADYPGNIDANSLLRRLSTNRGANVPNPQPCGIILYTQHADHCNLTDSDAGSSSIKYFTTTSTKDARTLLDGVNDDNDNDTSKTSSIRPDPSSPLNRGFDGFEPGLDAPHSSSGGSSGGGGSNNGSNAMIILYTITAIITILFLAVIIAGAMRAHRNPGRYGPSTGAAGGRPRQTRAKGLAMAMLETLPVVKFGDGEQLGRQQEVEKDVEMGELEEEEERGRHGAGTGAGAGVLGRESGKEGAKGSYTDIGEKESDGKPAGFAKETATSLRNKHSFTSTDSPDHETSHITTDSTAPTLASATTANCPICTDDFKKGESVRVLPCGHRYHPECVDPWLVNVSGTCPLCRVDLNPEEEKAEGEEAEDAGQTQVQAQGHGHAHDGRRNHHLSLRFSGLLHGRLNVEERILVLRRLRLHNNRRAQAQQQRRGSVTVGGQQQQRQVDGLSQQRQEQPGQSQQQPQPQPQIQQQQQQPTPQPQAPTMPTPPPQTYQPPRANSVTDNTDTGNDTASSHDGNNSARREGRRRRFRNKLRNSISFAASRH